MMKGDQERVAALLTDTVKLLCSNGLGFQKSLRVQGLLGITVDDNDVFIIQIDDVSHPHRDVSELSSPSCGVDLPRLPEAAVAAVIKESDAHCTSGLDKNMPQLFDIKANTVIGQNSNYNMNQTKSKLLESDSVTNTSKNSREFAVSLSSEPSRVTKEKPPESKSFSCSATELTEVTPQRGCDTLELLKQEVISDDDDAELLELDRNTFRQGAGTNWYQNNSNSASSEKYPQDVYIDGYNAQLNPVELQGRSSRGVGWQGVGRRLPNDSRQSQFSRPLRRKGFSSHYTASRPLSLSWHQFPYPRRPVNSAAKQFVCDYPDCDRSYYERKNLLQHQSLKHGRCVKQRFSAGHQTAVE